MKVERISAAVHARPTDARRQGALPPVGRSLRLTYENAEGADLIATSSNGLKLRLTGLQRWVSELQPGDMLQVKVLANTPTLELELEGAPNRAARAAATESQLAALARQSAMRLDQTALLQMAWQAPNAHALAKAWWSLAQSRWRAGPTNGADASAAPAQLAMSAPVLTRESASVPSTPLLQPWMLPIYAWGGAHMTLALIEPVTSRAAHRRARRSGAVLRLELSIAAIGRIVLLACDEIDGVSLLIAVERSASLRLVREAMQSVIPVVRRVGVRPGQVRVLGGDERAFGMNRGASHATRTWFAARSSSEQLFRVLAEAAVVLLKALPGRVRP